ncbi:MAG TPA: 50S ribosomal protein L25 [Candidatus Saccharimonas sp.]|jgi:large subunit ribosomal protein L25|nr:50S ribosomal protein L25 [Candidatus Saccharimonas sp.]
MGDKISLKVETRELHGKKVAKLREQGMTPAVVYGQDMEPLAVQADTSELRKVVIRAGMHTPVNLTGGKRRIAMIKSVDYDPTKRGSIRHVAFHAVNADEPVHAEVPIRLVGEGESAAERSGLIVLQALEKIEVKALPMDLPEALEVSILSLTIEGDRVTVADIVLPAGVEIVEHNDGHADEEDEEKQSILDLVVANVYEPSSLAAANDAAAGDAEDESEVKAETGDDTASAGAGEAADKKSE